ncbi:MAG: hypothetical protein ABMA01_01500 [Chthoniobacteraceae bacterium]
MCAANISAWHARGNSAFAGLRKIAPEAEPEKLRPTDKVREIPEAD